MHLPQYFRSFGPCYSWWLFPYERFNGILEQVEINGHPDHSETSLARWWIRSHLLHDFLERLPDDATEEERNVLHQLHTSYQSRGTLLAMTESVYGGDAVLKPSKRSQSFVDLRALDKTGGIYAAVLDFSCSVWPHHSFISDLDFRNENGRFLPSCKIAKRLQFVYRNSLRYGCESSSQTTSDQYAIVLANGRRFPVKILWHFWLEVPNEEPEICSIVARLNTSNIPLLPWDLHAEDLGYYIANDNSFEPVEAISPRQFISSVVTGPATMRSNGKRLRAVVAYDRVGHEIFEDPDANAEVEGEGEGV